MAASTESALTTNLRLLAKKRGAYINKNHGGPNSQGRPDLEGGYRGLHFGVEVKMPGKEKNVTKLQQKNLDAIEAAGGYAEVVTNRSQMIKFFDFLDSCADDHGMPKAPDVG